MSAPPVASSQAGRHARRGLAVVIPPLVVFAVIFAGWQWLVDVRHVQQFVLPSPHQVFSAGWSDRSDLFSNALYTAWEMIVGFAFGAGIGIFFATLMTHSRLAARGLYPVLITTQTIPPIAIAAPLVIWLGYGIWPKVIVTAMIVFFPVLVNAYQGLTNVDADLLSLMRSMNASEWQTFRHVRVPAASTLIFAAMKLAATYSVIGAVFGEWVGSDKGIGVYILQANSRLQTDRVYAAIFVLSLIGIVAFLLVALAEWLATPWRRRATPRRLFSKRVPARPTPSNGDHV
jgi:ABC-type nitrate/sulfonate/bicarbonate transport system permease component